MSTNSHREDILSRVRGALTGIERRATLPDWEVELAEAKKLVGNRAPEDVFAERIRLVGGRCFTDLDAVITALREGGWLHGYCDPALWPAYAAHFGPGLRVEDRFDRSRIDDYAFGITRARAAVAETGSIILDDASTSRRLAALTPWVHIAIVQKSTIYPFLADAVTQLPKDPNVIVVTGPSKTADVEGILIEGVHGPGQQWALLV